MKFEELLKKYRDGTATPEEAAAVEEELEKVRLIEEYLAEADAPLPLPEVSAVGEVKAVQRTITRRTRGTALSVVAGVLALIALLQFVLLPLANARVFDEPDYDSGKLSEYEISMDILTQLYIPFYNYYGSEKTTTGFGQWTVGNSFWGLNRTRVSPDFTVTAGVLDATSEEFFRMLPAVNIIDVNNRYQLHGFDEGDNALARLDDSIQVAAAVSFTRELTLEEVLALQDEYKGQVWIWSAALAWKVTRPMQLSLTGGGIGWGEAANEGYPLLWSFDEEEFTAEDWRQHFESQLRYLADHSDPLWRKFDSLTSPERMLKHYEQDGLTFHGLWVVGTGEELLSLYDSGVVGDIWGMDAYIAL